MNRRALVVLLPLGAILALAGCPPHAEHIASSEAAAHDVAFYTCPMHPAVKQDRPGQCPICHMDLVPMTKQAVKDPAAVVDKSREGPVGIETAPARRAPLRSTVRAVGRVAYDETRLRDVTLRVGGWVEEVNVDQPGLVVKEGQPLFVLSSPELAAAQADALRARATGDDSLVQAASRRLALWGMTTAQVTALLESGAANDRVAVLAPQAGVVVEKNLVVGARAEPGERLVRIARLERVWVEADVFAADVAGLKPGLEAKVRVASIGVELSARIARVLPAVDAAARTARVRLDMENKDGVLLPGMAAEVEIVRGADEALVVPASAILYTGPRRVVFLEENGDAGAATVRFSPRSVELGRRGVGEHGEELVEVKAGLAAGDEVVVSGSFLVAAEARLQGWEAR